MNILVEPLVGLSIGETRLTFGMTNAEIAALLGAPEEICENCVYYFGGDLMLEYNWQKRLGFVEFLHGRRGKLRPVVYGADVFETDEDALVSLLTEKNAGRILHEDDCNSFIFGEISVWFQHERVPASEEAFAWESFGFGVQGYYETALPRKEGAV